MTLPLLLLAVPAIAGVVNIPDVLDRPSARRIFFGEVHHGELDLGSRWPGLSPGCWGSGWPR